MFFNSSIYNKINETMKKIKKFILVFGSDVIVLTFLFALSSCNEHSKSDDSKAMAEEHNDAKFTDNKTENDAQFLVNSAEINLKEIQLGNLAAEKGTMAEVKDLGKMMAEAHSKSLNELKDLASKKQVTIPIVLTDEGQNEYKKLNESGNDFDKNFCDMMVNGHKDAIAKFEKAADKSADTDIKNWANATLPTLRKHLDMAITCQDNCKKMQGSR
jgi:putative membrane protein